MQGTVTADLELDLATSSAFVTATRAVIDESTDHTVVVDCAAITFMGSAAYHAMADLTRYAGSRGHPLVLENVRPHCARALALCDWDHELTIEPAG